MRAIVGEIDERRQDCHGTGKELRRRKVISVRVVAGLQPATKPESVGLNPTTTDEEMRRMDEQTRKALENDRTIDITTIGRKSGKPSRVEIWFHNLDDTIYITGTPGKRDWYANMVAHPEFTFHLKQSAQADLPARATPITDPEQRRAIFTRILTSINRPLDQLDAWVAGSPLVEVTFE
jgi:deazaflavin-dependent oxidoreductase (nitroreductase family)